MADKPNCYQCVHRGEVPGSAHSSCAHPDAGGKDAEGRLMSTFASVQRVAPVVDAKGASSLNIEAVPHGVKNGWFNWPYTFDPTWLMNCDGFESKSAPDKPASQAVA